MTDLNISVDIITDYADNGKWELNFRFQCGGLFTEFRMATPYEVTVNSWKRFASGEYGLLFDVSDKVPPPPAAYMATAIAHHEPGHIVFTTYSLTGDVSNNDDRETFIRVHVPVDDVREPLLAAIDRAVELGLSFKE